MTDCSTFQRAFIRFFRDSPDAGDPSCLCSWCGLRISEDEAPIFRTFTDTNEEARFHRACLRASGLLPQDRPDYDEGL